MCSLATITVYILDGSSILHARLAAMLSDLDGVEVLGHVPSVSDAVSAVRTLKPNVVIQDVQAADGSGLKVLAAIKQGEQPPLVIVLTNDAYPPYRKTYLQAGADFFLDKSSEFNQIPELLQRMLSGRPVLGIGGR
jgi:DNA-binding NarL/FixJ family response regulator